MLEPSFDYPTFLNDLKTQIRVSLTKAALAVNRELVLLYWNIGKRILEEQKRQGWVRKWYSNWQKTCGSNFLICKDFQNASYSTCGLLQRHTLKNHLCSRLLHKYRGATRVIVRA